MTTDPVREEPPRGETVDGTLALAPWEAALVVTGA
jgi:hypothetical protein